MAGGGAINFILVFLLLFFAARFFAEGGRQHYPGIQ
jgi:hypothetical protein